jgi:hypothetical protein
MANYISNKPSNKSAAMVASDATLGGVEGLDPTFGIEFLQNMLGTPYNKIPANAHERLRQMLLTHAKKMDPNNVAWMNHSKDLNARLGKNLDFYARHNIVRIA